MARQRQELLPNNLREPPPDEAAAPGRRRGDGFLDAGRVLMLWGWGTISTAVSTTWTRPPDDDAANATYAFLGLLLWLAGVSLVMFTAAARRRRFPLIARRGVVAVVTNLVMGCFFPPWN